MNVKNKRVQNHEWVVAEKKIAKGTGMSYNFETPTRKKTFPSFAKKEKRKIVNTILRSSVVIKSELYGVFGDIQ